MANAAVWSVLGLAALLGGGCASQRIDPHTAGDRCLYSCPEGLTCVGTTYGRGRALPGQCQVTAGRCLADRDCHARERCARSGEATGVCVSAEGIL